jgi:agmatinase
MKWMCLPDEYSGENSKFVIIPVSYEKDLTYGEGASKGCLEIIKASQHLEYYEEQFDAEPFIEGIRIDDVLELNNATPEEMICAVSNNIAQLNNKFVLGLGGDHAITIGMIKGLEEIESDFSVIVLDAHSDFRDSWKHKYNHACVSKNVSKKHDVVVIGVRSQDIDEKKQIDECDNVNVVYAWEFHLDKVKHLLPKLKDKVYISIDVDVFDPSFIRNTGTPEPGGLGWYDVLNVLKEIFEAKEVMGCDVVEFAPRFNFEAEAYSLARLVYKILALKQSGK